MMESALAETMVIIIIKLIKLIINDLISLRLRLYRMVKIFIS